MQISKEYKIIKELGTQRKRKFGKTYLLENKNDLSKAILKTIKKTTNKEHIYNRLLSEAFFDFSLDGLPKVIASENNDASVSLLLEYKIGVTVDEYWSTLKKKRRVHFLIDFLGKLIPLFKHLLENRITHCDIKPSNILIEEFDHSFKVHIIDFGLAHRENDTLERKLLFPLGYAAPELLLNHLDIIDQRADQFALGILIWRLYTGKLPLIHPNPSISTNLQLTHPLPEHSEVPRKVFRILQKMTHKHSFRLPPNKMKKFEVKEKLKDAIKERYNSFEEITLAFKGIKPLFYQIRSRR